MYKYYIFSLFIVSAIFSTDLHSTTKSLAEMLDEPTLNSQDLQKVIDNPLFGNAKDFLPVIFKFDDNANFKKIQIIDIQARFDYAHKKDQKRIFRLPNGKPIKKNGNLCAQIDTHIHLNNHQRFLKTENLEFQNPSFFHVKFIDLIKFGCEINCTVKYDDESEAFGYSKIELTTITSDTKAIGFEIFRSDLDSKVFDINAIIL